jgi:hypothetical protein
MLTNGKEIMRRAGPLVYPALFLLVAYSLSAGNAGTAFRYRTHLVAFLVAVLVVLRTARQEKRAAVRAAVANQPLSALQHKPIHANPVLLHGPST